ncbi:MAG TPA: hypothetical protein VLQ48_12240 [Chloroflexia bacterium]|nr:hypothetical protein [Chloroflexia bacterium]
MSFHRSQYLKQTDLFLVRVWAQVDSGEDGHGKRNGTAEWHGKVQRVKDGEVHQFDSLQDLTNVLLEMLSGPIETL